jgi:hypothetical protein
MYIFVNKNGYMVKKNKKKFFFFLNFEENFFFFLSEKLIDQKSERSI